MNQRYLKRKIKDEVNKIAKGRCEFVSLDDVRWDCRSNLHFEHIQPIAMGGKSTKDNLRKFCFNHNKRSWIKQQRENLRGPILNYFNLLKADFI